MAYLRYSTYLEKCDILILYNKASLLHRLIAYFTRKEAKAKAGHIVLYLFDDLMTEATGHGVRTRQLKNYNDDKYKLYIARYKGLMDTVKHQIIKEALTSAGERYAFFQIIVLMFKYIFKLKTTKDVSKKATICSEYIAKLFKDSHVDLFNKEPYEVVPSDYFSCDKLEITEVINKGK